MEDIDVAVTPTAGGYAAEVAVRDGNGETRHRVTVRCEDIERLAPGMEPAELVRASFRFLLEREPKESILREFDVTAIARYFPEYPRLIAARLRRGAP